VFVTVITVLVFGKNKDDLKKRMKDEGIPKSKSPRIIAW
jgi:hypothetical protein